MENEKCIEQKLLEVIESYMSENLQEASQVKTSLAEVIHDLKRRIARKQENKNRNTN